MMETPATIVMNYGAFMGWLHEVQGSPNGDEWKCPDFWFNDECGPEYPYSKVEGFINTAEGTVIARHLHEGDKVRVTFGGSKANANLVNAVRQMIGASRGDLGEAA